MVTADQLVAHACGDYLLQSDWAANAKTTDSKAAGVHVLLYVLPFLFLRPSKRALATIAITHYLIDRYRLARYVVWAKNYLAPRGQDHELTATGYPADRPAWLSVWLMIVADNLIHVLINGWALRK